MIIIDATGATSGIDFEAFIRGGFITESDTPLGPSWDNTPGAFTGEELFFSFGTEAASKYVLAHGEGITYDGFPPQTATHTVFGVAEVLEFGTRGSGVFNGDGYFTGGNVELKISGLDFGNLVGEAGGPLNNFALAFMGMGGDAAFTVFADALDSDAQTFLGSNFDDVFSATAFADVLKGGLGNDDLGGGAGADLLKGGDGDDGLDGGAGVDLLRGGRGKDLLTGGGDADTFIFGALKHSPIKGGGKDTILDFDAEEGDLIDLSGLQKKVDFIGSDAFSGDREVRYVAKGEKTTVLVDLNGDTKTDLKFKVVGAVDLAEGDFVL